MSPASARRQIDVYNAVGGAAFFRRQLREWAEAGADVRPHEAVAEELYRTSRSPLARARLRWRMWPEFALTSWRAARRSRADIRVVTTNPFFAPALVARAAGRAAPTIQILYDLYPDALTVAGRLGPRSLLARRCAAVTRFALRECAATVFLGERLRAAAESRYGPARRAVVIPVGADGAPFRDHPPAALRPGERLRILYCGLMGTMHDSATLAGAWADGGGEGCAWAFHASGAEYARLVRAPRRPADTVFAAPLPDEGWIGAMRRAHIALVTLTPGAENVAMPSKTYSALVAGHAVLAICPRASDLADLVVRHDCGWVIEPGDRAGLGRLLERWAANPDEVREKRLRAYAAGHSHYDIGVIAPAWTNLFDEVAARHP